MGFPASIIALVVAVAAYFLVNYDWQSTFASTADEVDSTQVEQVTGAEIDTTALPKDTAVAKIDSSNTAAEVKLTGIALPNGQTIETLPGSFVERFTKYVADTASRPSQVFVLENVAFEGNTANLVTGGEKNIQDLAKIMTAYPKVQVKITSHTDNTGDTLQNKTMSRKRALLSVICWLLTVLVLSVSTLMVKVHLFLWHQIPLKKVKQKIEELR
jgi:outer membrane protein OmpA-like peptidoglycan-associated protein